MNVEFNVDRVYGNISKLMKDQGIKVSEIESVMGVSAGYFSKLSKNQTVPNADVLYRIAQRLGVTVDMLIVYDLTDDRATDNLRLMTAYIKKVRTQSDAVELRWEKQTAQDLDFEYFVLRDDDDPTLVKPFKKDEADGDGEIALYYKNVHSKTRIDFAGDVFRTQMPGYVLYMSKLSETIPEGDRAGESIIYYGLDAATSKHTETICCSKDSPELLADLELLYVCLQKHAADLQMTESVRSMIDAFVNPPQPSIFETLGAISRDMSRGKTGGNE